jgi:sn-glycerol 3-phosphate transport system ATP-binding protein
MRRDLKTNTRVDVGIRPEDVRVLSDRDVALCMDVELVEELGATQLFHGRVGGADFALQAATGQVRAEGRQLPLGIDPANVHLFDRSTGERLVASP